MGTETHTRACKLYAINLKKKNVCGDNPLIYKMFSILNKLIPNTAKENIGMDQVMGSERTNESGLSKFYLSVATDRNQVNWIHLAVDGVTSNGLL